MKHRTRKPSRSERPRAEHAEDQATVTVGTQSWDALWATFATQTRTRSAAELEAEGFKSTAQLAFFWDVNHSTAEHRAKRLVEKGVFEHVLGRGGGITRVPTNYYRPVVKEGKAAA